MAEQLPCHDLLKDYLTDDGIAVKNPATGKTIATVRDWPIDAIDEAVDTIADAWADWRGRLAEERGDIMRKWYELMIARREDLAQLMTAEQGKVIAESRSEVDYGAGFAKWFAEEARRVYGDTIPAHDGNARIVTIRQPVGPVAAITPWNFPIAMITRKISPGLAVGCPVIVKPASATPLCALAIQELAYQAGIPREVYITVTSSSAKDVGELLCKHERIRKISFTGSTEVGKTLMEWASSTVKKVSLELGGNAPFIVFDDADVDAAIEGIKVAKFRNAGQTCICANRVLVQDGIYDEFMQKFDKLMDDLRVAEGTADDADIGPLIDADAVEKVEKLAKDAEAKGGKLRWFDIDVSQDGSFVRPGIVENASADMDLAQTEIFGPLAPIFRFKTEAEAIELANATNVGLAGYFYSRDVGRCWRVAEALEYGMVGINSGAISTPVAPFGGVKESGLGREGSKYGIDEYLEVKYLCYGDISG